MEPFTNISQAPTHLSQLPPEILLCIAGFADPEACLSLLQTCHLLHSLAHSRTFWINLIHSLRLRRPIVVDEHVEDINKLRIAALHVLRLHNKWENQLDYRPSQWRVFSPLDPPLLVNLNTPFSNMFVWFADEDTLMQVIGGITYWRNGHTGALITSFRTKHTLLFGDTCIINGELFLAVELENNPQEPSKSLIEIWRSHHPEGPVWEMEVASQLGLVIYKQHIIFLARDTPESLSARIVSLPDMEQWIVPIHFEIKEGSTETKWDIANGQFVFHYSVDDMTLIYSLRHEILLAYRTRDQASIEIAPKEVLRLKYLDGAVHQEITWGRRVYPSWDGGRVVVWRMRMTLSDETHLIASVHDISGSVPREVPITPTHACPDEDMLMDVPFDILVDNEEGYPIQHGGFSGKAISWLTLESTLTLLEIPSLEDQGSRGRGSTRSWRIPAPVGLEDHGEVADIWLDDSWGRVILAMQDETLIVFEFA